LNNPGELTKSKPHELNVRVVFYCSGSPDNVDIRLLKPNQSFADAYK
jgi:hypothetical protein